MILMLAPMEGVVDPIIRDIYTQIGGYSLCVTEFVRVTNTLLPPKVFYRYCPELKSGGTTPSGVPVLVQLLGSDPACLLDNALRAIELGAPGIDLNFGCPARTVNNHDGGASLLKKPERLFHIVSHLRKHIPAEISVSAKVRLGFEDKSKCLDIASAVEDAGASWLSIHARTKLEAYQPPAHWEYIARMRENRSIPVFANGDIWTKEDWLRCKEVSQCEDFILGRGAFGRPMLAREICSHYSTEEKSPMELAFPRFLAYRKQEAPPSDQWKDFFPYFLNFLKMNFQSYGPNHSLKRTKQWLRFLQNNYPEAATDFNYVKTFQHFQELLKYYKLEKEYSWQQEL